MSTTIVDDLQRATTAINNIESKLIEKGVITSGEEVAIEDYPDKIDEIGDELSIDIVPVETTSGAVIGPASFSGASVIKIEPQIYYSGIADSSIKIKANNNQEVKIICKEDTPNQSDEYGVCSLGDIFDGQTLGKITFENNYYDESNQTDSSAPLTFNGLFRHTSERDNTEINIEHIKCSHMQELFADSNISKIGDEQNTADLSCITLVARVADYIEEIGGLPMAKVTYLFNDAPNIRKIIMPNIEPTQTGAFDIYNICGDDRSLNENVLYIENLDLSYDYNMSDYYVIIGSSLVVNGTTGKIAFKNGSGFGNAGIIGSTEKDFAYNFSDVNPAAMSASLLDENYTPGTFTPTGTEKRTLLLNSGFNDPAYAADLAAIKTKFEAAGYTIEVKVEP